MSATDDFRVDRVVFTSNGVTIGTALTMPYRIQWVVPSSDTPSQVIC